MDSLVVVAMIGGIATIVAAAIPTLLQVVINARRKQKGETEVRTLQQSKDRVARFLGVLSTGFIVVVGLLVGNLIVQTEFSQALVLHEIRRDRELSRLYDVRIANDSISEMRELLEQERIWPGLRYQDCEDCPEMVLVPAGSFEMGSPDSEDGRLSNEGPQRTVEMSRMFWVGVYEVTNSEWHACVVDNGCDANAVNYQSHKKTYPITSVSWYDALAYITWISRKTGKTYRMLSEAEWEYVARARTSEPYQFGNTISENQANYRHPAAAPVKTDGTSPVGSFPANGFGLHDVHGNAAEWVRDCWFEDYDGAPSDGTSRESTECEHRVIRGGSWRDGHSHVRLAYRKPAAPSTPESNIGFRVARDA